MEWRGLVFLYPLLGRPCGFPRALIVYMSFGLHPGQYELGTLFIGVISDTYAIAMPVPR